MKVFISWSGNRSEKVAEALRDWLPSVIQSVDPFMSASDIDKGARWSHDLATHLEDAQFGLICLTQENLESPWLLFEAGALSKSLANSRVVPYLYEVSQTQLQGPLAQFQAAVTDKSSTLEVMKSINEALEVNPLDTARLEKAFDTWWPQLENALNGIPEATEAAPPPRPDGDILDEILYLCRRIASRRNPDFEIDPEVWRNLVVHGSLSEPGDPTKVLDADGLLTNSSTAQRLLRLRRRRRERMMQELDMQERDMLERDMLRRAYEPPADAQPASESESLSGNDADEDA